jgi:hypothetical protein
MAAAPAPDDEQVPGMPGTRRNAVEPDPTRPTVRKGLGHFVALFLVHPIVIVVALAVIAWIVWRLL